ncbi:hypothetical protein [Lacinutrix sp. Bg11-31]|nr:hypothetical protein [Lacinutrix sp. Bg11-31]
MTTYDHSCGIFAEGFGIAFLIDGLIILLTEITILWHSINMNKKQSS